MKKALLPLGTLGLVGATSLGVLGLNASAAADETDAYVKREDNATSLVLAADDDDDGTDTGTGGDTGQTRSGADGTGTSRRRADGTSSRVSAVSRDRDRSRGDLTRDWTQDGGDRTRDLTPNLTNDRSRNDTRG